MAEEKKGFSVRDRRFFSEETQEDKKKQAKEPAKEEKKEPTKEQVKEEVSKDSGSAEKRETDYYPLPEINFSTFIISLNASALVNLGVVEDPATGQKNKNLAVGKQTIDILGMLEEKTRGNLTEEEENLLKNILYELRINYVKQKS